jgi:hypothetical protein
MRPRPWLPGVGLLGLFLVPGAIPAQPGDLGANPRAFLKEDAGFSDPELAEIDRGRVVTRIIDTPDRSELLSVAAMRVKTSADRVLASFRDIESRRAEDEVLQIGRISQTPSPRDLEQLTLDTRDLEYLRKCRVGECSERLPADAIERFHREIDWSSPNHADKAADLWRGLLASYASAYLLHGNAGLVEYNDNREPNRIADTLGELLRRSDYLQASAPELHRYLAEFPDARPDSVEDIFYWLKEKFWLKSVSSLNHVTILGHDNPGGRLLFVTTKQLFANHYYEASLGVTVFLESKDPLGSYLVFVNRTRADVRPGGFNWIERTLAKRLVRARLLSRFRALKAKLDSSFHPPAAEEP